MKSKTEILKELKQAKSIACAYLFYGEKKEDVFDLSLEFASLILGIEKSEIFKSSDFLLFKKNELKIEDVRNIKNFFALSPLHSKRKVILINADAFNTSASNAILKILEEPPFYGTIIISAKSYRSFLPTILSRVQKIHLFTKLENYVRVCQPENKELAEKLLLNGTNKSLDIAEQVSKREKDEILDFLAALSDILLKFLYQIYKDKKTDYLPKFSEEKILLLLENIAEAEDLIKNSNANSRLILENIAVNL